MADSTSACSADRPGATGAMLICHVSCMEYCLARDLLKVGEEAFAASRFVISGVSQCAEHSILQGSQPTLWVAENQDTV